MKPSKTKIISFEKDRKNILKLIGIFIFYTSFVGILNYLLLNFQNVSPLSLLITSYQLELFSKFIPIFGILIITYIFWYLRKKADFNNSKNVKKIDLIIITLILSNLLLFYLLYTTPIFKIGLNYGLLTNIFSIFNSINYLFFNIQFLIYLVNGFLINSISIYLVLSTFIKKTRKKIVLSFLFSLIVYGILIIYLHIFEFYSEHILILSFFIIIWQIPLMKMSYLFLKYKNIDLKNHGIRSFALIFNNKNYRRGLSILEVAQISKNMITRENRQIPRTLDKLIVPGQKQYLFYHLLPLADDIQQLSYEIVISKYSIKLRFYISIFGNLIEEELINKLRDNSDLVETAFKSSFKDIEFKNLVGQELLDAWSEIVEYGNYSFKRVRDEIIEINRTTNNLYLSILNLDSIAPINANSALTQIDQLINNILTHNISVHYISVIEPSSKFDFFKQLEKFQDSNLANKTLDKFTLEDKLHHELLNIRHSEYIQMWNSSTYIVIKALDLEILKRHIQKIKAIFKQVFSNSMVTGNVKILEKKELEKALPKIIMRDRINNIKMSSEQVISTFHLPESVVPSISIKKDIPLFEIPPKLEKLDKRKIKIGTIYHGDKLLYNSYIDLEELRLNMFIVGQIGMGKTEFAKNILKELYKTVPNINWLVLEWKGDYKDLITRINEPIQVINVGSEKNPLKLNIFDPNRANPENHAMKIFSIIKEIFKSSYKSRSYLANYELSPQMEKIARDVLIECMRNPNKRNFKAFFNELKEYEKKYFGSQKSSITMSVAAIENRFQRLTTGVLGRVLNTENSNVNFQDLMNRKIIFDLSSVIFNEGTKEDVRLLINLILKYVIDQALRRGPTPELKHIVILEDSQLLVPEVLREVPETTLGEDIPLLLRSVGEAMISVATRPQISPDIISNSAIKVTFKLNQADDTIKVAKYQNLNEEQEQYLRLTKKQEAIVTTLNFPYPFRIKTVTSYPKTVTDVDIIKHNKKFYPEMYENKRKDITDDQIKHQFKSPEAVVKNYEKTKISKNDTIYDEKEVNKLLTSWELKCFQNLTIDYKKMFLKLRKTLSEPKSLNEISNHLGLKSEELNKYLKKFESLRLISFNFFPNFDSEKTEKKFHLTNNENYFKKIIEKKLKDEFYKARVIGDSDIESFDFFIFKNEFFIKIFTNKINETNKYFFKELFLQWESEILKSKRAGLIIIVPYRSTINAIKSVIKDYLKIPVKIFNFSSDDWEKLRKIINTNKNIEEIQIKEGISKDIDEILEDLDGTDTKEMVNKFSILESKQEKNNNIQNDSNSDKKELFSFIDNIQKKIKTNLEKN